MNITIQILRINRIDLGFVFVGAEYIQPLLLLFVEVQPVKRSAEGVCVTLSLPVLSGVEGSKGLCPDNYNLSRITPGPVRLEKRGRPRRSSPG